MDATLTPKQKKRLHEVADLMLQIFQTLARMRYLEPEWIEPGPHDISALMPLYKSLNIDPAIIYLYSILPYLNEAAYRHGVDFYGGGEFVDFRDRADVEQGRNPMHDREPEWMMRPWMTPLSAIGNHCIALLYDAKLHVIGIYAQLDVGSSDPNLHEGAIFSTENEAGERIYFRKRDGIEQPCDVSEWEKQANGSGNDSEDEEEDNDGDDDDGNDDEDEEEEGGEQDEEQEEDINHWDEMDARPAGKVLRDIIRWYHELFEIPGDGERTGDDWDRDLVEPIYRKHGWPREDFDGDAFLVDKMRAEAIKSAKEDAEELLQQQESLEAQLEWNKKGEESAKLQRLEKLAATTTVDEEWVVRWEIWQAERTTRNLQTRLKEVERSISAGGGRLVVEDLPLLELKHVEMKLLQTKHDLEQQKKDAVDPQTRDEIRSLEKQLAIYEKAYTASLADAERLCPGKAPLELDPGEKTGGLNYRTWSEELGRRIAEGERAMAEVRLWIAQLPDGAVKARTLAEDAAEAFKGSIESCSKTRQNTLDELEKHLRESSDHVPVNDSGLALALQALTGAYAAPGTKLNAKAVRPDEPPVFDAKPFPTNGTEEPYIPPHVDSPHFRLFLGPASETGAAEGLQPLEAAYDCFVGVLGWNSTGLSIRDPSEPYWKTEFFMQAEMAGGFSGLAHYGVDTGRAWVQLLDGVLTAPSLTVHELGHVLHFHQDNSFWGGMVNAQAWAEAVANWVADTYLTSDLCAASRAKHNQPIGQTVFHIYRTIGDSHLTIVDATNTQIGNHYDAWPFFHYLVLNPDNWHGLGRDAVLTLIRSTPAGAPDETPLHALERVLDGTATVREVVARYWARMAYVDVAHPQALRAFEENKAFLHRSNFDKVAEGRYRVRPGRAPRYMGASMAVLVPVSDDGAGTVAVHVTAAVAVHVTAAEAGASLVATVAVRDTASGSVRYVGLDGGVGLVDILAGEEATLVVVNAPEVLLKYDGNNLAGSEANKGLDYSFTVIGATVSMY